MELSASDQHRLEAAEGWHMMGHFAAAAEELSSIDPSVKLHPDVLFVNCRVLLGLEQMDAALSEVGKFIERKPDAPFGHIFRAMLLSYQKKDADAYQCLSSVIANFPNHATMHYDLGCYAARLNRWREALHWIKIALSSDFGLKQFILEDARLKPIHSEISALDPRQ